MSALLETLKNAGWVETILGECEIGEQVVMNNPCNHVVGDVRERDSEGAAYIGFRGPYTSNAPVLRAPRPEPGYPAGVVVRGVADGMEMNLLWIGHDTWTAAEGLYASDEVQVLRVLAHPDGTTPTPDLPEWDVERRYPAGTVVEADSGGRRHLFVSDGAPAMHMPWRLVGGMLSESSAFLDNPRILFIPEQQEGDQ